MTRIVFIVLLGFIATQAHCQFGSLVSASGVGSNTSLVTEWTLGEMVLSPVNNAKLQVTSGVSSMNSVYLVTGDIPTAEMGITVFPVPFKNEVFIRCNDTVSRIEFSFWDVSGRRLDIPVAREDATTLRLITHALPAGTYFLHVQNNDKSRSQPFKLIKK